MENRFLIPHKYKQIGWVLLIPSVVLGIATIHWDFEFAFLELPFRGSGSLFDKSEYENFTNEIAAIGALAGLMCIAFAREKIEDEFIRKLRMESLMVAVILNYLLLFLAIVFVYGWDFFLVLVYNMYTVLILFIARFSWIKMKQRKMLTS